MTGLHHPVPQRRGEEADPGRGGEHGQGRLTGDEDADGPLAGPHRERGGEAAEERGMAEALARAEDVHHLALVDELDRALAHDEQVLGGHPVLEQQNVSGVVAVLFGHGRDGRSPGLLETGEGREAAEELGCVHALHS